MCVTGGQRPSDDRRAGGRCVMRRTVRQRMGLRTPHGVRTPSAKPAAQARRPVTERVRTAVSRIQVPR
ncbi:hypothetical protein QFZ58_005161 [Streptomyces sp. B1I3]|nr:hypothetical protein [Streptomyces sp. B1I3]